MRSLRTMQKLTYDIHRKIYQAEYEIDVVIFQVVFDMRFFSMLGSSSFIVSL